MTSCIICNIVSGNIPSKKIYEDEIVLAVLDVNGANPGHCFVMPKNHRTIIEQVPDSEVARIFNVANKISTSIFESLGASGTNIFVTNGIAAGQSVAHFTVNVVPRKENDGINLQWQPKQLSEEEMSTVELKLKDAARNMTFQKNESSHVVAVNPTPSQLDMDEEDFYSMQLRRLP